MRRIAKGLQEPEMFRDGMPFLPPGRKTLESSDTYALGDQDVVVRRHWTNAAWNVPFPADNCDFGHLLRSLMHLGRRRLQLRQECNC